MIASLHLTHDEASLLRELVADLAGRAGFHESFDSLLKRWSHFVVRVERGYYDNIYDYTNDLSGRDLLEEIAAAVPLSLRDKLEPVIRSWDDRFCAATIPVEQPLLPDAGTSRPAWWWFRIPVVLTGRLRDDLLPALDPAQVRAGEGSP